MKRFYTALCALFIIACICCSSFVKECVYNSVEMCITTLIPSVFLFTVLSSVIVDCGIPDFIIKPFSYIFNKLFGISSCSVIAVLLGWTAGFPIGAISVSNLYRNGNISREEAEYLLSFCSMSGISFIYGIVGGAVYGDTKVAFFLYLIQVFSSFSVGLLMKTTSNFQANDVIILPHEVSIHYSIVSSVRNGVKNTAYICGYVIFFSSICSVVVHMAPAIPEFPIRGVFEITSASLMLKNFPFKTSFILTSLILSWSGVCVHFQVHNCVGELSMKKYYAGKILHIAVSSICSAFIPRPHDISAYRECISVNYRNNSPDLFFLIIFFAVLCCIFSKNDVK